MRFLIKIVLLWSLLPVTINAQLGKSSEAEVRAMFDQPSNIKWMKTWQGYWDLYHPVELQLAFDGKEFRGKYLFPGTDQVFNLVGHDQKGEWMLQELMEDQRISGHFVLSKDGDNLRGAWWSTDFTRSAPLRLEPKGIVQLKPFSPEILTFQTDPLAEKTELLLMLESPYQASGYFLDPETGNRVEFDGHCDSYLCKEISLVNRQNGEVKYQLNSSPGGRYSFREEGGKSILSALELSVRERIPLKILKFESYGYTMDAVYPVTGVEAFDKWIQSLAEDWMKQMKKELQSALGNEKLIELRNKYSASLWVDIALLNQDLLSGCVTFMQGRGEAFQREAFTFDRKSGERLLEEDIFRKAEEVEEILMTESQQRKGEVGNALEDPNYQKWVDDAEFGHFMVRPDGLSWATDFHPLYGEMTIFLSNEEVKSMVRNKSVRKSNF